MPTKTFAEDMEKLLIPKKTNIFLDKTNETVKKVVTLHNKCNNVQKNYYQFIDLYTVIN